VYCKGDTEHYMWTDICFGGHRKIVP